MVRRLSRAGEWEHDASRDSTRPCKRRPALATTPRSTHMQWQTPTATDLRFGFEITLYVAAR